MRSKRKFTPEFKAKVVLDAVQEKDSMAALAQKYSLAVDQINKWKREFKTNAAMVFSNNGSKVPDNNSDLEKQKLYEIIGKQKVEIDFLKKGMS
jgi:transposase